MPKRKQEDRQASKGEIVIYKTPKNEVELRVRLKNETIWLDTRQMAALFGTQRPAIVKHIQTIYKTRELNAKSTCSILEHVAADGKRRKINLYNLDVIISVGYRVNSQRATQFRVWATKRLKQYVIKGYLLNEKRLFEVRERFHELQSAVAYLQDKANHEALASQTQGMLNLLADYSKTLTLLSRYDTGDLQKIKGSPARFVLNYERSLEIIRELKRGLISKGEAGSLFGNEVDHKLEGNIKNLYQTFDRKELYKGVEEKAAHLLYLIVKDHSFSDGNKRIGSFLFVYFLDQNNYLFRKTGERKINDNALTALTLLVAESDPHEKDQLIALTTQLLRSS